MENNPAQTNQLGSTLIPNTNLPPNSTDVERFSNPTTQPIANVEETDSPADDTESLDSNSSNKKDVSPRPGISRTAARNITVQTLMKEGVLEAGANVLTIDYLGQKFCGDLLPTGKILWENTQFASPSSWATFIKKRLNPSKKSGSGWNSVKYKGKKLDKLKSSWVQKNNQALAAAGAAQTNANEDSGSHVTDHAALLERHQIKVSDLRNINNIDPNIQIDYEYYGDSKPQPFSVVVYSTAMAVMDFHCHLSTNEVVGYLGGKFDHTKKCLYITQAFPCRCRLYDQDVASAMEQEINNSMMMKGLVKVGWYHSHTSSPAVPTLRDVDVQFELQLLSGNRPAVGIICDPYFACEPSRAESIFNVFWVTPPSPNSDAPTPMYLKCGEISEQAVTKEVLMEFNHLVNYYVTKNEIVSLSKNWKGTMTYLDKIQVPLQRPVFSSNNTGIKILQYLRHTASTSTPAN